MKRFLLVRQRHNFVIKFRLRKKIYTLAIYSSPIVPSQEKS